MPPPSSPTVSQVPALGVPPWQLEDLLDSKAWLTNNEHGTRGQSKVLASVDLFVLFTTSQVGYMSILSYKYLNTAIGSIVIFHSCTQVISSMVSSLACELFRS